MPPTALSGAPGPVRRRRGLHAVRPRTRHATQHVHPEGKALGCAACSAASSSRRRGWSVAPRGARCHTGAAPHRDDPGRRATRWGDDGAPGAAVAVDPHPRRHCAAVGPL